MTVLLEYVDSVTFILQFTSKDLSAWCAVVQSPSQFKKVVIVGHPCNMSNAGVYQSNALALSLLRCCGTGGLEVCLADLALARL